MVLSPPSSQHGWYDDYTIQWINEMYPHDISNIMLDVHDDDIDEVFGEEDDSDNEESY